MEPTERYPVQEVRVDDSTQTHQKTINGKTHQEPNFLSPAYTKPKIVEFYAHWCPHCIHFKPQYIQFARKMKSITQDIDVFAVSCVPLDAVCRDQGVNGYPTVMLYQGNSVNGTVIQRNNLHPLTILRKLGMSTDHVQVQEEEVGQPRQDHVNHDAAVQTLHKAHFMHRSQQESYNDAHLSLDFALRNGVFVTNNKLPTKVKTDLQEFLVVVQKTLPPTAPLQPLIEHLIKDFNDIFSNDEADLETAMNQHTGPPSSTWSPACMQHGTGYTCGLWQLFHIVTIGAIEWNSMSPNTSQQLTPRHVADRIRGFVEHFFQCEECRMHFLHEYDSCSYDQCNRLTNTKVDDPSKWRELPLWLYETHNGVNARLRKERLIADEEVEDTTPQEVLWPPKEWCSTCWLGDGRWEDHAVYEFLRAQYWPGVTFDDTELHQDHVQAQNARDEDEPQQQRRRQQRNDGMENKTDDDDVEPLPLWRQIVAAAAIVMVLAMASIACLIEKDT
ncbi:MAG: hypothetical protein SGBAC_011557 [Bacillariaceae sp.]